MNEIFGVGTPGREEKNWYRNIFFNRNFHGKFLKHEERYRLADSKFEFRGANMIAELHNPLPTNPGIP